jgi:Tol biopolymer transport system component
LDSGKGTQGDIYKWDVSTGSIKRLTTWGYNFAPHVSPNGQWFVYLSVSQAAVNAMQSGAINAQVYANIWLFNPYTEEAIRIADQPANATYANGTLIGRTTDPVWSPDGGSVAWVEGDSQGERLAIYSLTSKSTATYPLNLPTICCEGASRMIFWGRSGIAVLGNEGTFNQSEQVVYVFSPNGARLSRSTLATDTYLEYGWALDSNNHEYLAGVTNGEFTLVDPFSNSVNAFPSYPELYSVNAPNSLAVHPAKNPGFWTVTRQGQNLTDLNNITDVRNLSVAPDGSGVVYPEGDYLQGGKLFAVLANGQTVPITPPARLLAATWGASVWRIHPG